MTALTRQDVQSVVEAAKSRIIESTASRQDIQTIVDSGRDRLMTYIHDFYIQNQQQFFRSLHARNVQYVKKLSDMESRIAAIEQEVRLTRQMMERLAAAEQRTQQVVAPMPEPSQQQTTGRSNYTYGTT